MNLKIFKCFLILLIVRQARPKGAALRETYFKEENVFILLLLKTVVFLLRNCSVRFFLKIISIAWPFQVVENHRGDSITNYCMYLYYCSIRTHVRFNRIRRRPAIDLYSCYSKNAGRYLRTCDYNIAVFE